MPPHTRKPERPRGSIDQLPSGAWRVRVHAGIDPPTKRRHTLVETIAPGPKAEKQARDARDRMVREVAERKNVRTNATVDQLLERYLEQFDGSPNAMELYRTHVRNHISPLLGHLKLSRIDAETLPALDDLRPRSGQGRAQAPGRGSDPLIRSTSSSRYSRTA